MKRIFNSIFFFAAIFFLTSSHKKNDNTKKNYDGIGRWSGTVTMEQTTIYSGPGMSGRADKKIVTTFVDALPTMYRNVDMSKPGAAELKFKDDKGTGSYSFHSEVTISGIKGVTDCNGSGEAELHAVTINESDHTYDIEVIGPACNGTTTGEDGGTQAYGPDNDDDITITEPLGSNRNELYGSTTGTAKDPTGWTTTTTTINWHLTRTNNDDVLIITPQNYDTWLPEPGKDEFHAGNTIQIHLALVGINGSAPKMKVRSFILHLFDISSEPGITINSPSFPIPPLPDIRFAPRIGEVRGDTDQTLEVKSYNDRAADVTIESFDGGGFATLTAEAILEDNSHIKGHLIERNGETEVLLPKRSPGSHIGTAWLNQHGNPADDDDNETSKGNRFKGDGFTAYEEYRGVISEGKFKRLDPQKKEVGILAMPKDFSLFGEGITWFRNASDLEPVRFDYDKDETSQGGQINFNFKSNHDFDQYAIYILNGSIGSSTTLGATYCDAALWIPPNIKDVVIDWKKIQRVYQTLVNEVKPGTLKFTLQEYLNKTVAHELGHAVNIDHHGGTNEFQFDAKTLSDSVRIFDRNGNLITRRRYLVEHIGDSVGTVESGDMLCMLSYYPFYWYGGTVGADGAYIFNQVPLLPLGRKFCTSETGTGINATKLYFGKAAMDKGNCLGHIQLRN